MKNVAYMLDGFPVLSETFIIQEILELKKRGLNIIIFAREGFSDIANNSLSHHESQCLLKETCYLNPYSIVMKKRLIHFLIFIRHPIRYLKTFYFSYFEGGETFIAFKSVPLYIREMKKENVHHIHAHFARRACTFSMLISMITGIPFSFTAHAHDIYDSDAMDISNHILASQFVITCTAHNKSYLLGKYGKHASGKVYTNYHGVDTNRLKPAGKRIAQEEGDVGISILSIGRLVEKKGFPYLIQALSQLKKSLDTPFTVNIIGDGPEKDYLYRMVKEYNLSDNIFLRGALLFEDIRRFYTEADFFVLPCIIAKDGDRDGIPNVILEAMSAGLPVISTKVSGIPEVITDGVDGILVSPQDSSALADSIKRLSQDQELRLTMGCNARKKMTDRFNKEKHIDELMAYFTGQT
ncbi:MAG: glycosyltransferase [Nitrospirae bacterium]|nr:glycosyltransferase [Nitrospirota bacterium]